MMKKIKYIILGSFFLLCSMLIKEKLNAFDVNKEQDNKISGLFTFVDDDQMIAKRRKGRRGKKGKRGRRKRKGRKKKCPPLTEKFVERTKRGKKKIYCVTIPGLTDPDDDTEPFDDPLRGVRAIDPDTDIIIPDGPRGPGGLLRDGSLDFEPFDPDEDITDINVDPRSRY